MNDREQYPAGKFNDDDEGTLSTAVGHERGKVIVRFEKSIAWMGLTPEGAEEFAKAITKHADAARRERN